VLEIMSPAAGGIPWIERAILFGTTPRSPSL
jgi:hypothetical protein